MANNNNCLFNAALAGFLEGNLQAWLQSATQADYAAVCNAAAAFAREVDSKIAFDSTITTSSGTPTMLVSTASNTIQSATQVKPNLLKCICAGAMSGRYSPSTTDNDYSDIADRIKAAYTEAISELVSP